MLLETGSTTSGSGYLCYECQAYLEKTFMWHEWSDPRTCAPWVNCFWQHFGEFSRVVLVQLYVIFMMTTEDWNLTTQYRNNLVFTQAKFAIPPLDFGIWILLDEGDGKPPVNPITFGLEEETTHFFIHITWDHLLNPYILLLDFFEKLKSTLELQLL